MRVIAIIQARMNSRRLPGKVLLPLCGKPVLEHVVTRVKACAQIEEVIVATSTEASDDPIADWSRASDVNCFRGSLDDVLDRFYQCALQYGAESVVRITADCPVVDPAIIDEVIAGYYAGGFDYYGLGGEFPDGLDCTVISFSALSKAWQEAKLQSEREHVGPYIEKYPDLFNNGALNKFTGLSHLRWTLDEPEDYQLLNQIYDALYSESSLFLTQDILDFLEKNPEMKELNSQIIRNEGYLKSLEADGSK